MKLQVGDKYTHDTDKASKMAEIIYKKPERPKPKKRPNYEKKDSTYPEYDPKNPKEIPPNSPEEVPLKK